MFWFFGRWHRIALAACSILLIASAPTFAWNDEGHMGIAFLAYQKLRPVTKSRVNALLKLNPYYAKWLAALPAGTSQTETDRVIFMIAATWPDQIRNDPAYTDDGPNNGNTPPNDPKASQNIGYTDHLRHKYWHFVDIPFSQDGSALPAVPAPNIETQIALFRAALSSGNSDDVKSYDLTWLEHLVGDVHQPLHAVTRITAGNPEGDAGGNLVLLCSAPCRDELHFFWDRLVGSQSSIQPPPPNLPGRQVDTAAELESATAAAKTLPSPKATLVNKMDGASWVHESFLAAESNVYVPPIGPGTGPYAITPEYFQAARKLANERVALAGARLANLLNKELK
jgi:hypothetical protein